MAISFIADRVLRENNRPVASHWQTLSHNAVSSTPWHKLLLLHINFKMFILNSLTSNFALLIKWGKLHFTRHYQYWDHYASLILNQCLSTLKLCVRFPLIARCTLYIFIMFMSSSFRDLLQVSCFIDIPVSFTILNHHLLGNILLQVMLSTNYSSDLKLIKIVCV